MQERLFNQIRAFVPARSFHRNGYLLRLGAFTLISMCLLITNHFQSAYYFQIRRQLNDGVAFIFNWVGQPLISIERSLLDAYDFLANYQRMQVLASQLDNLAAWQNQVRQLHYENQKLRTSLHYVKRDLKIVATARAFYSFEGRYMQSMIVDAGELDGVKLDQPVLAYGRLIGRIIEVSPHSARLLLITDTNSRIPIETEWSNMRAILSGTNTKKLIFLHERDKRSLLEGELVLTTGEGNIFPAGYLIGRLCTDKDDKLYIDPGIEWRKIDVVQVLQVLN